MVTQNMKRHKAMMTGGALLVCLGLLFPLFTQYVWFDIVVKIREAINAGDSGHLILASASANFLYAVQCTMLFLGVMLVIHQSELKQTMKRIEVYLLSFSVILVLHWLNGLVFDLPWEPISTIMALLITLFLFERLFEETYNFIQVSIVSVQVFFAFQWLNIMPLFSIYRIGQSDISYSIKIAGVYLQAATVLNFTGFAFFLPFITSAFITATLFMSYSKNIHMMRENYEKESEIRNMRAKALENRIYQEVKSLVHDLKTPLVTIRGLNSLLTLSNNQGKLEEYSDRIENSVTKMSEMISSFLYESSRQKLKATDLISYIRAQLPLEDEKIKFDIHIEGELPEIYVNKIRIARAVINILENAIIVPYKHPYKLIRMDVKPEDDKLLIIIQDNGIGINEADLPRIWEVGYSTNNTSGLGLPFAKQIIEDNEGTIAVSSQPDQGTSVTISLPLDIRFIEDQQERQR